MEKASLLTDSRFLAYGGLDSTRTKSEEQMIKTQKAYWRRWNRATSGPCHKALMCFVSIFLLMFMLSSSVVIVRNALTRDGANPSVAKRVPLEIHIMSKCPDAQDCLRDMIMPAMQNVSDKIGFTLSHIGSVDDEGAITCKHGPEECLGNILELCAAKLYPDPKTYLSFTWCLTKDYERIPSAILVQDCALEHDISYDRLNECMSEDYGSTGITLLEESFRRSDKAGVKTSCTIRLNGKTRCVRDGGEWEECKGGSKAEDLVRDVNALYDDNNE